MLIVLFYFVLIVLASLIPEGQGKILHSYDFVMVWVYFKIYQGNELFFHFIYFFVYNNWILK